MRLIVRFIRTLAAKASVFAAFFVVAGMLGILAGQGVLRSDFTQVPAYGDLAGYFLPLWQHFRGSLLNLEMPIWEPSQSFGFFYLGNPQCGLFHIPNYILLLPKSIAYSFYIIFPYLVGSLGVYSLLKKSGARPVWAAVSSCIVVGNPLVVSLHTMPTATWTYAWIPWIFYAIDLNRFGWAGFCLAQAFLAGAWDIWGIAILGVSPFLLQNRILQSRRFWFGVMALLPAQIIWSVALLSETTRGVAGLDAKESLYWAAGIQHLIGFVSPRVEVSPFGAAAWSVFWGERQSWLMSTYVGLWAVLFFPMLLRKYWKLSTSVRFAILVNSGLMLAAFLPSIPLVMSLLVDLGFRSPIRYPDKLLAFPLLFLAFAGLRYLPVLIRWTWMRPVRSLRQMVWLIALVAASSFLLETRAETMVLRKGAQELFRSFYFTEVLRDILGMTALYGMFLIVPSIARRVRFSILMPLFAMLLVGDVCFNGTRWGQFSEAPITNCRPPPISGYGYNIPTKDDPFFPKGVHLVPNLSPFWIQVERFPFLGMDSGIAMSNMNNVLAIGRTLAYQKMFGTSFQRDSALFWRAGISTLTASGYAGLTPLHKFCSEVFSSPDSLTHLCHFPASPMVRVVGAAFMVESEGKALKILDSVPVPSTAVLLEVEGIKRLTMIGDLAAQESKVDVQKWHNGNVRADVQTDRLGWCVVLMPWMKILTARVDGSPQPLLKADLAFSAVRVAPGRHTVEINVNRKYIFFPLILNVVFLLTMGCVEWWFARSSSH